MSLVAFLFLIFERFLPNCEEYVYRKPLSHHALATTYGGEQLLFTDNWPVRRKILSVSLILIVITALIGLTGYVSINRVITSMEDIYDTTLAQERFLGAMESRLYRLDRTLQAVTMAGSHSEMLEATERFGQDLAAIRQIWSEYIEGLGSISPERQALYDSFHAQLDAYALQSDDVIHGSVVIAMETAKEASLTIDAAIDILQEMADQFLDDARAMQANTEQVQDTAHKLLILLMAGGLVLGILLSLWVAFSVSNPLRLGQCTRSDCGRRPEGGDAFYQTTR